ncbi:E3 ubiquitin-protein ligase RNF26 [Trichomycterus rosablanca]|uniref:E3 ubiquitin-protein ligase RNF26 n=1 Tax=Trichomycterus rosablanca TaxID=2290929 RepID=UPI002F3562EE
MGLLHLVFSSVGKCLDVICFLLDLNFVIVNTLVRLLLTLISFINSLPMLLTSSIMECGNLILFYMITVVNGMTTVTHNVIGGSVQVLGGMLESCKMMGYLTVHLLLRMKELLHRGLISGQGVLRQACECCTIAFSLLLYFVNTVINMLLIGTQNLYAVLVSLVEAISSPLQKAFELTLTVMTFFYSTLVGTSLLLWTPLRLAVEFLSSLGHLLISVFLLNSYGLLVTVFIIVGATAYLNPALIQAGTQKVLDYVNSVPALRQLQRTLRRLQRTFQRLYLLARHLWQSMAGARSRLNPWTAGRRAVGADDANVERENAEGDAADLPGEPEMQDDDALDHPQDPPLVPDPVDTAVPSSSTHRPLQKMPSEEGSKASPAENLLTLLQEQEERKKCVICQDSSKTVVLLPCRHLCLCRDCTDILLHQPIYQQNCPLCRHMILQTMDVYL